MAVQPAHLIPVVQAVAVQAVQEHLVAQIVIMEKMAALVLPHHILVQQ
jgi:hypothetical protein